MKSRKFWVGVVLVVGVGGWWLSQRYASAEGSLPPLLTEEVDRGDIAQRVVAYGNIQPVHHVTVGSQVSGIVDEVFVDFNARVTRGQVLAQIDSSTFAAAVSSATAELESAESGLELARRNWERIQELRTRQVVPASDLDQAEAQFRQAEAQVQVRRHALDAARRELDRTTITAPADGIVISRTVDPGQTVAASLSSPELFEIASDLAVMHIHALVSEADIGRVSEGDRVLFSVDAHRGTQFHGEVVQVRNAPRIQDNVVHYETLIRVANEEGHLKPGMTAEVSIIISEVHDVLRVRNTALRARLPDGLRPPDAELTGEYNGRVYRLENGRLVSIPVITGLTDGVHTEIRGGIAEGDVLTVGVSLASENSGTRRSLLTGNQATF